MYCRVKWDDSFSEWFRVVAGVKQGGILSPSLYCIYVDELIKLLESMNVGCYIVETFMAALYADDMALLAPSVKGLSLLLQTCSSYCLKWDICLNEKKSKAMYFGKKCTDLITLLLNGKPIEWVETWPYLGDQLVSGKRFGCSAAERIRKFYRCHLPYRGKIWWSNNYAKTRGISLHSYSDLRYGTLSLLRPKRKQQNTCSLQFFIPEDFWLSYIWKCYRLTITSCPPHLGDALGKHERGFSFSLSSMQCRFAYPYFFCTIISYHMTCNWLMYLFAVFM